MRVTWLRISCLILDLIFIIGTSFQVDPFANLLSMSRHSTPVVVINNQPVILPNEVQATYISGDCDDSILSICERLGWKKELLKLYRKISGVQWENIYASVHPKSLDEHQPRLTQNDQKRLAMRGPPRLPPVVPEDNQYLVEMILDHRRKRKRNEFLIRWLGYSESFDEWVKRKNVCSELVKEYFQRKRVMGSKKGCIQTPNDPKAEISYQRVDGHKPNAPTPTKTSVSIPGPTQPTGSLKRKREIFDEIRVESGPPPCVDTTATHSSFPNKCRRNGFR